LLVTLSFVAAVPTALFPMEGLDLEMTVLKSLLGVEGVVNRLQNTHEVRRAVALALKGDGAASIDEDCSHVMKGLSVARDTTQNLVVTLNDMEIKCPSITDATAVVNATVTLHSGEHMASYIIDAAVTDLRIDTSQNRSAAITAGDLTSALGVKQTAVSASSLTPQILSDVDRVISSVLPTGLVQSAVTVSNMLATDYFRLDQTAIQKVSESMLTDFPTWLEYRAAAHQLCESFCRFRIEKKHGHDRRDGVIELIEACEGTINSQMTCHCKEQEKTVVDSIEYPVHPAVCATGASTLVATAAKAEPTTMQTASDAISSALAQAHLGWVKERDHLSPDLQEEAVRSMLKTHASLLEYTAGARQLCATMCKITTATPVDMESLTLEVEFVGSGATCRCQGGEVHVIHPTIVESTSGAVSAVVGLWVFALGMGLSL